MNDNNKKIREYLEKDDVPEKISPENIQKMLEENAPQKKRKNISAAGRIAALAAACVVIIGGTVHVAGQKNLFNKKQNPSDIVIGTVTPPKTTDTPDATENDDDDIEDTTEKITVPSYMAGAESYEQVYTMFEKSAKKFNRKYGNSYIGGPRTGGIADNVVESVEEAVAEEEYDSYNSDDVYFDGEKNSAVQYATPKTSGSSAVGGDGGEVFSSNGEIVAAPENPDEETTETPTEEPTESPTEEPTEEPTQEITEEPTEPPTEETTQETTDEISTETTLTAETSNVSSTVTTTAETTTTSAGDDDFSDTYSQEENVREADIAKTDGKNIYYVYNDYRYAESGSNYGTPTMNIVTVDNGKFRNPHTISLMPDISRYDENYDYNVYINDMYVYDNMLIVIGNVWAQYNVDYYYADGTGNSLDDSVWYGYSEECFVSFYTQDAEPKLIGTYFQDGNYNDVRISPDGYMYLISNYYTADFENIGDKKYTERYIPCCGTDDDFECLPPEDILLPKRLEETTTLEYTVIGGIDLTEKGTFSPVETKALTGYSGQFYMSENNIYTTLNDYSGDITETEITRISVNKGNVTPEASGNVLGYIKDQFSMSEYDGYFRIATTRRGSYTNGGIISEWLGTSDYEYLNDNCVYVLDMDMNIIGCAEGLGENETIKSVSYSGNIGYVVTYRQTDPLYAIDLSDPANPVVLDEYKILGYSNYMQKWTDGLLFGFGADADENGIETGVKLVMFDNSDPENLKEVGYYSINHGDDGYLYSEAMWERKALLIAPEKNLIGVPIHEYNYDSYVIYNDEGEDVYQSNDISKYMFFSYEDGEFKLKGELGLKTGYDLQRAVYIGKYVYALGENTFIAADIETLTETDRINF